MAKAKRKFGDKFDPNKPQGGFTIPKRFGSPKVSESSGLGSVSPQTKAKVNALVKRGNKFRRAE